MNLIELQRALGQLRLGGHWAFTVTTNPMHGTATPGSGNLASCV
jgi:hypothetical protein